MNMSKDCREGYERFIEDPADFNRQWRVKAPAEFIGLQPGIQQVPDIELFNLVGPVGPHPAGSTVSRKTLEAHGYSVP